MNAIDIKIQCAKIDGFSARQEDDGLWTLERVEKVWKKGEATIKKTMSTGWETEHYAWITIPNYFDYNILLPLIAEQPEHIQSQVWSALTWDKINQDTPWQVFSLTPEVLASCLVKVTQR